MTTAAWQLDVSMVSSPSAVEGPNDFFRVVPPTPHVDQDGHALSMDPSMTHPEPFTHHLRPSHSLRTHRSMSSLGSVDSRTSAFSGNWSTISSDTLSETDYDPSVTAKGGNVKGLSLSIDPKLFQPKEFVCSDSNDGSVQAHEDQELTTDVPPQKKSPKPKTAKGKKSKGSSLEDRKKVSHARKQQPDHIPRPRNAFILFRKHVVDSKLIPASVEMRHQNVSIITAKMWSEAPAEQKAHFNELAKKEKEEHMRKYPGYRYQPVYRRTNVIRRRVRKDEAEEEKCRSVAELLLKGKSGEALESEIKEKIAQGGSNAGSKKTKTPSQRSTAASELSKGALRSLRAQARQQSASGDWSDLGSRANSPDEDSVYGHNQALYGLHPSIGQGMPPPNGYYQEQMAFVHPALGGWNFSQHEEMTLDPVQLAEFASGSDYRQIDPSQGYAYPQPQPIITDNYQFYDMQLPFSPHAASFNFDSNRHVQNPTPTPAFSTSADHTHQSNMPQTTNQPEQFHQWQQHHHHPQFGGHHFPTDEKTSGTAHTSSEVLMPAPYPSPTAVAHGTQGDRTALWDHSHFTFPSSHDLQLGERLETFGSIEGMEEGDLMLHDFGAALAQAGEVVEGDW